MDGNEQGGHSMTLESDMDAIARLRLHRVLSGNC